MISYSFEPDYTTKGRHYAHSLVSWPSVAAGAVIAVALGAVLNLVGLAIGAAAFNPFAIERHEVAISIGGGLYVMFSQFVAFQLGGYIAARSAPYPDHFGGALTGVLTWALAVAFGVTIVAIESSGGAGANAASRVFSAARDAHAGMSAGEAASTETSGDALSVLAWWGACAMLLGVSGAIAGGWIGAHHPDWKDRPRREETVTTFQQR